MLGLLVEPGSGLCVRFTVRNLGLAHGQKAVSKKERQAIPESIPELSLPLICLLLTDIPGG